MRQDIVLPVDISAASGYEHFEFYELHAIPRNSLFDADGNRIVLQD